MKVAIFHPSARAAIRLFPEDVRREFGKAIFDLQKGEILSMPLSRGMSSIAPGAAELRVFHASVKKSQTTPNHEMELGKGG